MVSRETSYLYLAHVVPSKVEGTASSHLRMVREPRKIRHDAAQSGMIAEHMPRRRFSTLFLVDTTKRSYGLEPTPNYARDTWP